MEDLSRFFDPLVAFKILAGVLVPDVLFFLSDKDDDDVLEGVSTCF